MPNRRSGPSPFSLAVLMLAALATEAQAQAQEYPRRQLVPGDAAPNFKLKTIEGDGEVELAAINKPVVLYFGSFT